MPRRPVNIAASNHFEHGTNFISFHFILMPNNDYRVKGGGIKIKKEIKEICSNLINPERKKIDLMLQKSIPTLSKMVAGALDNGKFTVGGPHPDGEGPNPEEIFALVKTSDDTKVSFKTGYGKYIGVDTDFQLIATAEAIGVREQFQFVFQDGKTALQAIASPLFMSLVPSKDGYIYVASRKATEDEMINARTDMVEEGPVDWRSAEDKKSAKECELAYVKMYQHSKVDLKGRHISIDVNDKKSVRKAQQQGNAHELLLDQPLRKAEEERNFAAFISGSSLRPTDYKSESCATAANPDRLMLCKFSVLLLLLWSEASLACLTSGVCGSSYCAAPAAVACQPASCQPGYSCGQYGCARNRARSALTKKIDGIFIDEQTASNEKGAGQEQKHNIFGLRRGGKPSLPSSAEVYDNKTMGQLTNPNYIFRQCCEQRGLPDACLSKCHFNTYTRDSLQAMYFKSDACPLEAAADMHFCAAQGRDHSQCCVRNGVTTTLAGAKCLTFCDQRPDRVTKLDYSYVPCYDKFESMKRCFYTEIKYRAEQQFGAFKT
ncbi:unnamed protein product [Caenorhabditis auriculariae]|uniref:Domain of unknown function DB domain-containing protein n=1 Tax=Caenorhabditis auriculariae TaxID=2777116 RepID=A0A8S1GYI8_9PELO|nr:unnamed protein product [Caenorhabditis auriculariae]